MNSCAAPFGAFLRLSANYRRPGVWTAMQSTSCGSCVVLKHPHPLKPPFPARETKLTALYFDFRHRAGAAAAWRRRVGVSAAACVVCVSSGGDSQVWRQWQRRRSALLSFLLVGASTLAVLVSPRARFLLVSPLFRSSFSRGTITHAPCRNLLRGGRLAASHRLV